MWDGSEYRVRRSSNVSKWGGTFEPFVLTWCRCEMGCASVPTVEPVSPWSSASSSTSESLSCFLRFPRPPSSSGRTFLFCPTSWEYLKKSSSAGRWSFFVFWVGGAFLSGVLDFYLGAWTIRLSQDGDDDTHVEQLDVVSVLPLVELNTSTGKQVESFHTRWCQ